MLSALRNRGLSRIRKTPAPTVAPAAPFALRTSARQLVANLTVTATGAVWAGYRMEAARWDYLGEQAQESVLSRNQDIWAGLTGHDLLEKTMTRPHPVDRWAANLDKRTPHPLEFHTCEQRRFTPQQLLDGACGCETWNRHLVRMQRRISQAGLDDKFTVRYFRLGQIDPTINVVDALHELTTRGTRPAAKELLDVLSAERAMLDTMRSAPWRAHRLTETEQRIVRARSLAPGAPAGWVGDGPAVYDELSAETSSVRWHEEPFDQHLAVTSLRGRTPVRRLVSVLTLLRPAAISYPESGLEPWQIYPERVTDAEGRSFPVELTLAGRVMSGEELQKQATYDLNRAQHTMRQYDAFPNETPHDDVAEGIDAARRVRTEVFRGEERVAGRFRGSVNATLWAEDVLDAKTGEVIRTAEEVLAERTDAFKRLMRGNDLRQHWDVAEGQAGKLTEGIPGEPMVRGAYQRQFPLSFLAAGLPNVSASLGDGAGPYEAYTRGGARRPFQFDTHYTTEGRKAIGRKANLWIVVASLGGGKSIKMMVTAYNAVRRGIRCVYSDPSGLGPARMAAMPEIAPGAVVRNMTNAEPGELSPPSLVRMPTLEEFDGDTERYLKRIGHARAQIRSSVEDVVWMLMPQDIWDITGRGGARTLLRETVGRLQWSTDSDLWQLVDALEASGELGTSMARVMREASESEKLSALFAPRGQGGDFVRLHTGSLVRPTLTVITTPGLISAASGVPRGEWNADEMASPVLRHLAAQLTSRELFDKAMSERACGFFDEAHHYKDSGSGRAMLQNLGRDHSKWNIHGEIASQDLDGALVGDLRNYLAGAFVGQMKNIDHAQQLLPILHIEDKRYASQLLELSVDVPGEFVVLDADGRVGAIRVDTGYFPELEAAIFTNPNPEGSDAWDTTGAIA